MTIEEAIKADLEKILEASKSDKNSDKELDKVFEMSYLFLNDTNYFSAVATIFIRLKQISGAFNKFMADLESEMSPGPEWHKTIYKGSPIEDVHKLLDNLQNWKELLDKGRKKEEDE